MKTAVIYKSNYGATKQYSIWLATELNADLIESKKLKSSILSDYDTIIYGGGIYASATNGVSILAKNEELLKNKKIVIFGVGLAGSESEKAVGEFNKALKSKLSESLYDASKHFLLRGAIDLTSLKFPHGMMMNMMKKMLAKAPESAEAYQSLFGEGREKQSYVDEAQLAPIVEYVKSC